MEVSRTLADPSFIVFCCVFADLFAGGLSPIAHQVQGILEPSEFKRCERRCCRVAVGQTGAHSIVVLVALLPIPIYH